MALHHGATDVAELGNPACTPRCQSTSTGSVEKSEKILRGRADEIETSGWNRWKPKPNTAPRSCSINTWAISSGNSKTIQCERRRDDGIYLQRWCITKDYNSSPSEESTMLGWCNKTVCVYISCVFLKHLAAGETSWHLSPSHYLFNLSTS